VDWLAAARGAGQFLLGKLAGAARGAG
jgi:hypothetical protein